MAELTVRGDEVIAMLPRRTQWNAIWAGVFVFTAIWCVFGALGVAIFLSVVTPATASGWAVGLGIWEIVLTIIAMYVAGHETGRLAEIKDNHTGITYGMALFGLSLISALVVAVGVSLVGVTIGPFMLSLGAAEGFAWIGFLVLFFGWIGAMSGTQSAVRPKIERKELVEFRPAA